jgi:hypothetical protein
MRGALSTCLLGCSSIVAGEVAAMEVVRATETPVNECLTDLSGPKAVWKTWVGEGHEVFLYDGEAREIRQLSAGGVANVNTQPWISDDYVYWSRPTADPERPDLVIYDGTEVRQVTEGRFVLESVVGDHVLWKSKSLAGISALHLYDGVANVLIAESTDPDLDGFIRGSDVYFLDHGVCYVFDGSVVRPRCPPPPPLPRVWAERRISTEEGNTFTHRAEIDIYYADNRGTTKIWSRSYSWEYIYEPLHPHPVLAGNVALWTSIDAGPHDVPPESEVYVYRDGVVSQLTDDDYEDFGLVVSKNRAAWIRTDGAAYQILLYDRSGITEVTAFDQPSSFNLKISGSSLAWSILGVPSGTMPRCDLVFAPEPGARLLQLVAAGAAALLSVRRRSRGSSPRVPGA